jgi:hypothetical protein
VQRPDRGGQNAHACRQQWPGVCSSSQLEAILQLNGVSKLAAASRPALPSFTRGGLELFSLDAVVCAANERSSVGLLTESPELPRQGNADLTNCSPQESMLAWATFGQSSGPRYCYLNSKSRGRIRAVISSHSPIN